MPTARTCPICLNRDFADVPEIGEDHGLPPIVISKPCGLVMVNPMTTNAEKEARSTSVRSLHRSRSAEQSLEAAFRKSLPRAARCLDLFSQHIPRHGEVLEIGSGDGAVMAMLARLGVRPTGLDPDEGAARFIQRTMNLPVIVGSLEDADFQGRQFDAVVMVHLIEHLYEPVAALRSIHRLLKPGGLLFLETPNILRPKVGPKRVFSFAHNYHFSPRTLTLALHQAGFAPSAVRIFNRDSFQIVAHPEASAGERPGTESWQEVAAAIQRHRTAYLTTLQFLWRKTPWLRERIMYGRPLDLTGLELKRWLKAYPAAASAPPTSIRIAA